MKRDCERAGITGHTLTVVVRNNEYWNIYKILSSSQRGHHILIYKIEAICEVRKEINRSLFIRPNEIVIHARF
jgi:hypothetical protein